MPDPHDRPERTREAKDRAEVCALVAELTLLAKSVPPHWGKIQEKARRLLNVAERH